MTEEMMKKEKARRRMILYKVFHFMLGLYFLMNSLYRFFFMGRRELWQALFLLVASAILLIMHRPSLWFKEETTKRT